MFLKSRPWGSHLVSGYIALGDLSRTTSLCEQLRNGDFHLLLTALKTSSEMKTMNEGLEVHYSIVLKGYEQDLYVANTLIDMYMKCGSILDARSVFDFVHDRNVVTWNALIRGYVECGLREEALTCFNQMESEGVAVDAITCFSILKACHPLGVAFEGIKIHTNIVSFGLEQDLFVGSSLVSMYAKSGLLTEAVQVFDALACTDVVTWTAFLSGCADQGAGEEVLKRLEQMREKRISPSAYVYACSLKACGTGEMVENGRKIHSEVVKIGYDNHIHVGSSLIDMYSKNSLLDEACNVLDSMPERNIVSWNTLLTGFSNHEPGLKALKRFEQMQLDQVSPDAVSFASCLKSCAFARFSENGQILHTEIVSKGLEEYPVVGNALMDMYAKSGFLMEAQEVFDQMAIHDVISFNVLIAGYVECGCSQQAVKCYNNMESCGITPSAVTFSCILEACWKQGYSQRGQKVHAEVIERGFDRDYCIGNVLVSLYADHGLLADACQVFDGLPVKSAESWTALISGYSKHEQSLEACRCFDHMQSRGVYLDAVVYACVLKACASNKVLQKSQEIHIDILKRGFERDSYVGTALLDAYCKCGLLLDGQDAFNRLLNHDVVAWNALICGYTEHGPALAALECYDVMQAQRVLPSTVTYVSILKACCIVGATDKAHQIHKEIRERGYEADPFIASTLIVMYAACGSLSEAWEAFDKLRGSSVVPWNAMLKGYAMNHEGEMALHLFDNMLNQGLKPGAITVACLLAACSRTGLVMDSEKYLQTIMQANVVLSAEHLSSVVNLLARSGDVAQADRLCNSFASNFSKEIYTTLLTASLIYEKFDSAKKYFEQLVRMDKEVATPYLVMAKVYSSIGRWDDANDNSRRWDAAEDIEGLRNLFFPRKLESEIIT
ncbi:hypothetical protein KP509_20G003600 [Ceratopteris richardii]|nr:hypothetical protein KP509_20G003600 [Ceratopteris richardii]